ncbi:MAG: hypothetical protein PHS17_09440 [Desulfobacterales bacterium]|nr:hypothetical protein [Desulfobacterales bacterium]
MDTEKERRRPEGTDCRQQRIPAQQRAARGKRLYAHGQGYDLVERPGIRDDEPMKIQANMNITVHPIIGTPRVFAWACDNYLVTEKCVTDCLHRTPKKIFEIEC